MVHRSRLAFCFLLGSISTVAAQGFTPPQPGGTLPALGGLGGPIQLGAPATTPAPASQAFAAPQQAAPAAPNGLATQPAMASADPGRVGPGFGALPAPPAPPQQPARQNLADELTDFHVPPQSTLQANVGTETPLSVPGGHLITTAEVRQAQGMQALLIDVLAGPPHPTLPGALAWPGAGSPGSFDDTVQQNLWKALSQATQSNPAYPIIFLCAGARCWESYNATLRAANMGFKTVLWYRGGLASWQAAGLPMVNPGQAAPAPQPAAPPIGFGRP